jgi:hypothetical protein
MRTATLGGLPELLDADCSRSFPFDVEGGDGRVDKL